MLTSLEDETCPQIGTGEAGQPARCFTAVEMEELAVGATARDSEGNVVDLDTGSRGGCLDVAGTHTTGVDASLAAGPLLIAFHASGPGCHSIRHGFYSEGTA